MTDAKHEAPAEGAVELVWLDVRDAPQDGTPILLNHRTHGIIQGRFSKGEWSDDTPISPREYSGDMWILGDDLYQDDVEFGEGGVILPSGVLGWLPLSALRARSSAPEAREDGYRRVDLGMVATTIETMHRRIEELTGSRQSQYDGAVSLARDLYLPAAPSADKLRIAVAALERIAHEPRPVTRAAMREYAAEALAALKAEGC